MRRTAFTLPRQLKAEFTEHVTHAHGYGPRRKSLWIREAIELLFNEDPGLSQVGLGTDLIVKDAVEPVYLDERAEERIKTAFRTLRTQDPEWEGLQSDILRAAVSYRLTREIG